MRRNKNSSWTVLALLAASLLAGADANAFSFGSLFGNDTSANSVTSNTLINNSASAVGTSTGNNMNSCPVPLSSIGSTVPLLPCGGAIPLANQGISFGGVQIGTSSGGTGTSVINNPIGDQWCTEGTPLTGSTITVSNSAVTLILPASYTSATLASGSIMPLLGSVLSIPNGTPVSLSLTGPGAITLPTGGTFLEPDGVTTCSVPAWGSIVAAGGGVYFPDGASCTSFTSCPMSAMACDDGSSCNSQSTCDDGSTCGYICSSGAGCDGNTQCQNVTQLPTGISPPTALVYGNSSLSINTSSVLAGTVSMVNSSVYPFPITAPGTILVPEGATFVGPMNNDTYSIPPNGVLTVLGNRQVQMPGAGGLFTYAPGTATIGLVTPTVVLPPTFRLAVDPSAALYSPQNSSSTCPNP